MSSHLSCLRWWTLLLLTLTTASAAPWADASNEIDPANPPPEWRELFAELRAPATIRATFEERRLLGFRSQPVVLKGELRLARNDALSLHYLQPDERTVIVDAAGVLLRDARGRSRSAPAEARESIAPLLQALHFDLTTLGESYTVHGWREDQRWQLAFEPRASDAKSTSGAMEIAGTGAAVESIYLAPSPRRRIAITLLETERNVEFSPSERQRFFR